MVRAAHREAVLTLQRGGPGTRGHRNEELSAGRGQGILSAAGREGPHRGLTPQHVLSTRVVKSFPQEFSLHLLWHTSVGQPSQGQVGDLAERHVQAWCGSPGLLVALTMAAVGPHTLL